MPPASFFLPLLCIKKKKSFFLFKYVYFSLFFHILDAGVCKDREKYFFSPRWERNLHVIKEKCYFACWQNQVLIVREEWMFRKERVVPRCEKMCVMERQCTSSLGLPYKVAQIGCLKYRNCFLSVSWCPQSWFLLRRLSLAILLSLSSFSSFVCIYNQLSTFFKFSLNIFFLRFYLFICHRERIQAG